MADYGSTAALLAPEVLGAPAAADPNASAPATGGGSTAPASAIDSEKLSGKQWRKIADDNGWKNSTSVDDLSDEFRPKVQEFLAALDVAKAKVEPGSTYRHPARAWLMHWAWEIAKNNAKPPADDPHKTGIIWDHKDDAETRSGAAEMVTAFNMAYPAVEKSRHEEGNAIDMTITWTGDLSIKKKDGTTQVISSEPRHGGRKLDDGTKETGNEDLHEIGKGYGAIKLASDPPHWSTDGH